MKYILFILLFSGCSLFKSKPPLPGESKNRLRCIEELLDKNIAIEEALTTCKFIMKEK